MRTNYARTGLIVLLGCLASAGLACTQKAADATKEKVGAALDATKAGANKAIDATKAAGDKTSDAAQKTADTTAGVAGKVTDTAKDAARATGNAVTDTWITAKLKAKFADETSLKGSHINIDTSKHVVTLTGTVMIETGRVRAGEIAVGTDGVVDVINHLVVKSDGGTR